MTITRTLTWIAYAGLSCVGGLALVGGLWWIVARLVEHESRRPAPRRYVAPRPRGTAADGSFLDGRSWRAH